MLHLHTHMSLEKAPYTTVIITAIKEETPDVKTFTIQYEDGSDIAYTAGQFITFVFHHHGREDRRSFSISSAPGNPLSFTVKRIDNGAYSRLLADRACVGDKLLITGTAGLFTLPADMAAYRQLFFFAAGIGITPIISLVKTVLQTQPGIQATLIYSNRTQSDTVFYNELEQLKHLYPGQFKVEYLYSTSFNLMRARLNKALVPILLKEYAVVPKEEILCYVCGPFAYMRMVIWSLEEWGIPTAHIRRENFNTNDRAVPKAQPPDKEPHTVTLIHAGQHHTFPVQYPETILQAAKRHGIHLPYSCEVGRCGSCAARCTSGRIWLSYNEVLMDTDLKAGSMLTCTAYPIAGDVTIQA